MPRTASIASVVLREMADTRMTVCRGTVRSSAGGAADARSAVYHFFRLFSGHLIALRENFAIGRHTGFGKPDSALQLQFYAHHLFHALVAKISVLRSECRLRIDAGYVRVDGLLGVGIEIYARGLVRV